MPVEPDGGGTVAGSSEALIVRKAIEQVEQTRTQLQTTLEALQNVADQLETAYASLEQLPGPPGRSD
jgi:hypothetical protein